MLRVRKKIETGLSSFFFKFSGAFNPSGFTADVQEALIEIWQSPQNLSESQVNPNRQFSLADSPAQLMSILSPRNVVLLGNSPSPKATWDKMELFLGRLLKANLIIPLALEDTALQILRTEWPTVCLSKF